jgi:hypothetical protein
MKLTDGIARLILPGANIGDEGADEFLQKATKITKALSSLGFLCLLL